MKLRIILSFFVAFCLIVLSGCAGEQLEDMDILTTYFADAEDGRVKLGGGVANVRTLSDSMADKPVSLIFADGEDIAEAEDNLDKSADHPLFFGGVRAVIVSRNFAEGGIYEFAESLKSDYKLRSEAMFFITEADPVKIVTHKAINDFTGGFAAESLIKNLGEEGRIAVTSLSDIFEMMSVKKSGLAVAQVDIKEDIMRFDGYGIFDGDRFLEFADSDTAEGINIFLNKNASYNFYFDSKRYMLKKKCEKKSAKIEDGKLFFDIEIEFEGEIPDEAVKEAEKTIKAKADKAFKKSKELGCDFLELYRAYQKNFRYEFETADYRTQLENSDANIKISCRVRK